MDKKTKVSLPPGPGPFRGLVVTATVALEAIRVEVHVGSDLHYSEIKGSLIADALLGKGQTIGKPVIVDCSIKELADWMN